jgi:ATP-dependent Clp protease ATP-binding subunit ClpC
MSQGPGDFGSDPWDEFLARYFGRGEARRSGHRVDITRLMTADARELLADAARRAAQAGGSDLDTDHLLWAALQREPLRELLRKAGADPDALVNALGGAPRGEPAPRGELPGNLSLTPAAKRALLDAHQLSRAMGASYIGPEHILMALPLNPESPAGRMLAAGRVQPQSLQAANAGRGVAGAGPPDRGTPTLDQYGQDLTDLARADEIDPVIGRADVIEQAVEILSRRTKNNPVLIGEAGVGKTAIVEGLAERIADGDVPGPLLGKRVVQLDLAGLVAGTRYRGDFEERLKKVIDEIRSHGEELIVFLDELHTLVGAGGAGSEGGMDASNMLKPALARGELRVIGATTLNEYRRNIEKDAALARRFQPVLVSEPSVDDTVAILRGLRDRYEAHHQVRFTDEALVAAAELSDRYLTDRFLPDKAIDLVDQAGARVRLRTRTPDGDMRELERELEELQRDKDQAVADEQYERASGLRDRLQEVQGRIEAARGDGGQQKVPQVRQEEIAEVVSRATGIPVSQLTEEERDRLLRLEGHLHERVIGQDDAVNAVAEAVRRSRTGLADPNRPMGSFLFLGPTGVGKTELARALAEALFGESDRMVRLDMSEFQERHTVSRLVGAPPGYVGYEEAGQLTEAVRRRPYAVVLLDEIEKAHADILNILLQVMDDGRLTDSQGRTVNFRNAVLIMTSNLGSELITGARRSVGFGGDGDDGGGQGESSELRDRLMRRLQEHFRPEFLNRIDEVIIFRRLETEQLRQITELLLEETRRRLHAQDIVVEFTTAGVDWIAEHGHQPEFGARPLRRTIQREIDNRLSRMLLEHSLSSGQRVVVDARDGALAFDVSDGERNDRRPAAASAGR